MVKIVYFQKGFLSPFLFLYKLSENFRFFNLDFRFKEFNAETADRIFYEAGKHAGNEFCKELITQKDDFNEFVIELQELLKELKIGILRIEKSDLENMNFTLTVAEDLDCSGLPASEETICIYDEGFISGLFSEYTGSGFDAREIDCWCSGDRVCRFEAKRTA